MRDSCRVLLESIKSIKESCQSLVKKNKGETKEESNEKKSSDLSKWVFAERMKKLISIPELIWNALQEGDLIQATKLYNEAKEVYTQLGQSSDKLIVTKL